MEQIRAELRNCKVRLPPKKRYAQNILEQRNSEIDNVFTPLRECSIDRTDSCLLLKPTFLFSLGYFSFVDNFFQSSCDRLTGKGTMTESTAKLWFKHCVEVFTDLKTNWQKRDTFFWCLANTIPSDYFDWHLSPLSRFSGSANFSGSVSLSGFFYNQSSIISKPFYLKHFSFSFTLRYIACI